jgi:hypothetical protein
MSSDKSWNETEIRNEDDSVVTDDYYQMAYQSQTNTLTVSFGRKSTSKDHLVQIAKNQIDALTDEIVLNQAELASKVLKLTGAMTNMITAVIIAALANKVKAIALYDPEQAAYVIVTNKDGSYQVGTVWRAAQLGGN